MANRHSQDVSKTSPLQTAAARAARAAVATDARSARAQPSINRRRRAASR